MRGPAVFAGYFEAPEASGARRCATAGSTPATSAVSTLTGTSTCSAANGPCSSAAARRSRRARWKRRRRSVPGSRVAAAVGLAAGRRDSHRGDRPGRRGRSGPADPRAGRGGRGRGGRGGARLRSRPGGRAGAAHPAADRPTARSAIGVLRHGLIEGELEAAGGGGADAGRRRAAELKPDSRQQRLRRSRPPAATAATRARAPPACRGHTSPANPRRRQPTFLPT